MRMVIACVTMWMNALDRLMSVAYVMATTQHVQMTVELLMATTHHVPTVLELQMATHLLIVSATV